MIDVVASRTSLVYVPAEYGISAVVVDGEKKPCREAGKATRRSSRAIVVPSSIYLGETYRLNVLLFYERQQRVLVVRGTAIDFPLLPRRSRNAL